MFLIQAFALPIYKLNKISVIGHKLLWIIQGLGQFPHRGVDTPLKINWRRKQFFLCNM